jgi:D-tagatose-1,6-bisphosphate aldolase subunit GatZ/KbaZ
VDDLRAGFDILHVDATEDANVDGVLDLTEIARRTTELITYLEEKRETEGLPEVHYEVGTEEITGGMTDTADFERFIELLKDNLREARYENVMERVLFVVGQVGTTMRVDMENGFERSKTRELTNIVDSHEMFLKVHYTDWLDDSDLSTFPELGVGAANVGPEFAAAVVRGLETLERREREAMEDKQNDVSDFMEVLEQAAVEDAPWRKFAPSHLDDDELETFAHNNRRNIALCVGRYVLNQPDVIEARQTMYENLQRDQSVTDPNQLIVDTVRDSIRRYVRAFN